MVGRRRTALFLLNEYLRCVETTGQRGRVHREGIDFECGPARLKDPVGEEVGHVHAGRSGQVIP